ncbi:uncharacterized protein BX663DRAFT_482652 [Cokeromyces recurvatus]|uniref:uncharacterized protein n=1 Tax=Cokeromyces recurvatus TaxID=90255 RepID=UPI0022208975|nr:uncharacterized protein BX663DRAFT_482652 [Cokeromyces recurvatus]KAI7906967.1 hypothetical protein BX663DRAFT_482652 [Cokeromyces recurvatus]
MKFSTMATMFIGFAALVVADDEIVYFLSPTMDSEFTTVDEITFTANDITNDADERIIAKLYNAGDNTEIKQIGSYTGESIVRPDDHNYWSFNWVVDVPPGTYYVRLFEQDADGDIDDDDEWDNQVRSHDFQIKVPVNKKKRAHFKRSQKWLKRASTEA